MAANTSMRSDVGTQTEYFEFDESSIPPRLSPASSLGSLASYRSEVQRSRRDSTTSRASIFSKVSNFIGKIGGESHKHDKFIAQLELEHANLKERLQQEVSKQESLKELLRLYNSKLGDIDLDRVNINSPVNIQIGNQNSMIVSDANNILVSFYEAVKESVEKLLETSKTLKEKNEKVRELDDDVEKLNNENLRLAETVTSLEIEREKFQEVVENLRDIQLNMDIRDKTQSMKLDYTLSLTDSSLMEKSIRELQDMRKRQETYYFKDITKNAQFGVIKILRKYCLKDPKLTVNEFADSLGVAVHVRADCEINEDTCTDILVKWVQQSPDNTVDVLVGKYPRLRRFGSVRGNIGSQSLYGSISMLDVGGSPEMSEFLREMKDWLTEHTDRADKLLLDRIKSALKETCPTATVRQLPIQRRRRRQSV